MKKRHVLFNMHLTTTISVALVLFLVGVETVFLLSAHDIIRRMKENVTLTLVLRDDADSVHVGRLENLLTVASFVHQYKYVSKDDALQEHIANLGEDPTAFLGVNPLQASYEVNVSAAYAQVDSIAVLQKKLEVFPCIESILYPKDMVALLDTQISRVALILLALAAVLLTIALALILNTIRLHIYSKRFLINTMKLVGATPWVIKWPIVRRNIWIGLWAAVLALAVLAGAIYYCRVYLGIILLPLTKWNIGIVCGIVLVSGIFITGFAAWIATNRYIRMKTDDLYYV